ncbi:hypothetical protein AAY473_034557 [Plecturocebus cupreus]
MWSARDLDRTGARCPIDECGVTLDQELQREELGMLSGLAWEFRESFLEKVAAEQGQAQRKTSLFHVCHKPYPSAGAALSQQDCENRSQHRVLLFHPGWSTVVQFRLTATFVSRVQVILLPQPPEYLGLQVPATMPGQFFLLGRLRQKNVLNLEGEGCSEPRLCHCTAAWATRVKLCGGGGGGGGGRGGGGWGWGGGCVGWGGWVFVFGGWAWHREEVLRLLSRL